MGDKDKDKSKNHFQKFKLCSHLDELAHHSSVTGDEDDPCASSWILDDESPRECSNMNSCRRFLERIVINKKTTCVYSVSSLVSSMTKKGSFMKKINHLRSFGCHRQTPSCRSRRNTSFDNKEKFMICFLQEVAQFDFEPTISVAIIIL